MPLPSKNTKFKRGFKKWSDTQSVELRKRMGLLDSSPLCAFELCKYLNIKVLIPTDFPELPNTYIDELLIIGTSHWSAFSLQNIDGANIIVHNPNHSPARQQSNLMHEVAHILCKHTVPVDKLNLGLGGFLRDYDEQQENEAEWLGACLQLPRPLLLWALKKNMSVDEICDYFNASSVMVNFRINITGVKRQLSYMGY